MELFILSTNVQNRSGKRFLEPLLNQHPSVNKWSIDLEDIDKVLRIEAKDNAKEGDIIELLKNSGIKCASLPD
tara:strand:- start:273 stop:491 length:219 start_codon:yes stop_codon:yes gene_type:complete